MRRSKRIHHQRSLSFSNKSVLSKVAFFLVALDLTSSSRESFSHENIICAEASRHQKHLALLRICLAQLQNHASRHIHLFSRTSSPRRSQMERASTSYCIYLDTTFFRWVVLPFNGQYPSS